MPSLGLDLDMQVIGGPFSGTVSDVPPPGGEEYTQPGTSEAYTQPGTSEPYTQPS